MKFDMSQDPRSMSRAQHIHPNERLNQILRSSFSQKSQAYALQYETFVYGNHKYDTDVANSWPQNPLATSLKTQLTDVLQYIFVASKCF